MSKLIGICAGLGLLTSVPAARANPIPCDIFAAQRSEDTVVLTLQADKACYSESPHSVTVTRDFFPLELEFAGTESADYFTLTATDVAASARHHFYELNYLVDGGAMDVYQDVAGATAAQLDGTLVGSQADLVLTLDKSALTSPLPTLEYQVRRGGRPFLLDWTESEETAVVRCTATDDTANPDLNRYEVGVRAGTESFYTLLSLYETVAQIDAGVVAPADAAGSADDADLPGGDDGDGGCAASRSSRSPPLLLLLALLLWRRRS